ncbi:unnamed protein product [Oikopleura dioica]|uniref:Uncharacterized protein n=1 Tax=Oikopleura dioica TaxID=34765 RepID=E4YT54_OIKDI|nr:unnamed protein product [Oikopleura dioica]
MRIKNKICCKENISVSSDSDAKYKIRRSNSKRQRMAQTSSKNPDKVLPVVANSKNTGVISWILSFFGARKGRGLALKSKTCSEPELGSPSAGKNPAKFERSSDRKSVSDLLQEFNQQKVGEARQQRTVTTSRNVDANQNEATVNTRKRGSEEGNSSKENLLSAKSELATNSQSSPSISRSTNSSDHEQTPNKMEILAKKLDKINLNTAENIKRGNFVSESTSKLVSEEAPENPEADVVKRISRSPSSEDVQQPKKSVKALGALLQMKGPLPMPGLAGMAAPPPSLRKKVPNNAEMCLELENEQNTKSESKITEDQFTSEKLKVNLRQRAAKTKRPVSRKFRNSMQLSEMTMLED